MGENKKVKLERGELIDILQRTVGIGRVCVEIRRTDSENLAAYVPLREAVSLIEEGFLRAEENTDEKRYNLYLVDWRVKDGKRHFQDRSYKGVVGEKRLREHGIEIVE